ncbi:hypothetical protein BDZ94DRAFT_1260542 [Collybia nuda]|uniref:Uncharacterized protein n=1 Tax=Collybia nuda TaxID=64659 RepID=A0A9P6CJB1_9AGAR|nr:hypothetical protein BDZ94DRAFT_1260542 [Collybia nuda]
MPLPGKARNIRSRAHAQPLTAFFSSFSAFSPSSALLERRTANGKHAHPPRGDGWGAGRMSYDLAFLPNEQWASAIDATLGNSPPFRILHAGDMLCVKSGPRS